MEQSSLKIENSLDLLLTLLYSPGHRNEIGEPVEGITRLQKLLFLLQQDVGPKQLVKEAMKYKYIPYKMGPYAAEISEDIDFFIALGIVTTEPLEYWLTDDVDYGEQETLTVKDEINRRVVSNRYMLTRDKGMEAGRNLWENLKKSQQKDFSAFKKYYNSLTLRQLIFITYQMFPKYTTQSEIIDSLGIH